MVLVWVLLAKSKLSVTVRFDWPMPTLNQPLPGSNLEF